MLRRIPQPPLNPALRALEHHSFWPGFVAALLGLILAFHGARRLTGVETVDGGMAWETQLVKAYTSGGLQYADQMTPPPPPSGDDPAALDQWARKNADAAPPSWKIRVDTEAKTPCPT